MEKLIDDGYDVRGYFYWTLIDNFEVRTLVSASLTLPLHCHCMASAPIPQSWLASHVAFGAAAVEFCVGPEVWPLRVERRWHPAPHAAKWRQGPLSSTLPYCPVCSPHPPAFKARLPALHVSGSNDYSTKEDCRILQSIPARACQGQQMAARCCW